MNAQPDFFSEQSERLDLQKFGSEAPIVSAILAMGLSQEDEQELIDAVDFQLGIERFYKPLCMSLITKFDKADTREGYVSRMEERTGLDIGLAVESNSQSFRKSRIKNAVACSVRARIERDSMRAKQ